MSILSKLGFGSKVGVVSPQEALQERRLGNMLIVDVREETEWSQTGTPQGSHRISLSDRDFVKAVEALRDANPGCEIAVSCKSGMRSNSAIKLLRNSTFENAKFLDGGMMRWLREGLPIDGQNKQKRQNSKIN